MSLAADFTTRPKPKNLKCERCPNLVESEDELLWMTNLKAPETGYYLCPPCYEHYRSKPTTARTVFRTGSSSLFIFRLFQARFPFSSHSSSAGSSSPLNSASGKRPSKCYAPPDHPVFKLVPPIFDARAQAFYAEIGEPVLTIESFWPTYRLLLRSFHEHCVASPEFQVLLSTHEENCRSIHEEPPLEIQPGLKPLQHDGMVFGHLNADESLVFVEPMAAEFTDSDSGSNIHDSDVESL
jgi:hypothetical protein